MVQRARSAGPASVSGALTFGEGAPPAPPGRDVYSVSRLNREAKRLLEQALPLVLLEGELSNLVQHGSGHWYFSLKDDQAQVRCAMFRAANLRVRTPVRSGLKVLVRARVSLYEARGEFQLIVEQLEEAGEGALRRRFEELKAKLAAEGLFAAERKRTLPALPRRIGVVTSPSGAALRDILHVLARRFPAVPVLVYPVAVQGAAAAAELREAVALAAKRAEVDVLILARGGGSIEDLWAFNDEGLARAIAQCPVPVVSGVGHEIDFTICDLVADVRAPTPSGAAELVVPDRTVWLRALRSGELRLTEALGRSLRLARDRSAGLARRLDQQHPGLRLAARWQRLDELEARASRALSRTLEGRAARLDSLRAALELSSPRAMLRTRQHALELILGRLQGEIRGALTRHGTRTAAAASALRERSPASGIAHAARRLSLLAARLDHTSGQLLLAARTRLGLAARALGAVSPLATLERGYAIVRTTDGGVVRTASALVAGDTIHVTVAHGTIQSTVTAIER